MPSEQDGAGVPGYVGGADCRGEFPKSLGLPGALELDQSMLGSVAGQNS